MAKENWKTIVEVYDLPDPYEIVLIKHENGRVQRGWYTNGRKWDGLRRINKETVVAWSPIGTVHWR